jgi:hypothetical protein
MSSKQIIPAWTVLLMLWGCASAPTGPNVQVMPGPGKSFEAFQTDDAVCRQYAQQQTGASPGKTAGRSTAGGAAAGGLIGAGLGAAIGAATGSPGAGAAIGGATGVVGGGAIGSGQGRAAGESLQGRYDIAYEQCMYAKGNQVPGYAPRAQVNSPPPPLPPER